MGSWSVYCGISRIAITAGRKCVFLPLFKKQMGDGYMPYIPATLPIFGEYDDYGGLEKIEHDENTDLIEWYFDCKIEDFCEFFTRGIIRDDEDDFPVYLKKIDEIKGWTFMFIDREVYDFMSTHTSSGFGGKGHIDYGDPKILELLGFTYNGEKTCDKIPDPKRYNQEWEFDGEKFYSDGTWLYHPEGSIHTMKSYFGNGLLDYIEIPKDKLWVGEKTMWQLWKYLNKEKQSSLLGWILGRQEEFIDNSSLHLIDDYLNGKITKEEYNKNKKKEAIKSISKEYFNKMEIFGERLSELVNIRFNLHCMSGYFEPFILYLTPQDGEYQHHQVLLDKFAEINRSIVEENGYDEEE